MTEPADAYTSKSPDAGRMGKAAEYLVAAVCILATRGRLNVSTSIVDDEGIDLVFHLRESTATLAVQVKARMTDGSMARKGRFQAFVRSQTFQPRDDLDMLFVLVDNENGAIEAAWLVPSADFDGMHGKPTGKGRFPFSAAISASSKDKWSPYRLTSAELAARVVERLKGLDSG